MTSGGERVGCVGRVEALTSDQRTTKKEPVRGSHGRRVDAVEEAGF